MPFAVKGGGHATNPGFSSTPGVHISMTRFNSIVISTDQQTVEIGAGLTWTDVYAYLVPKGLNVVGGRQGDVGVAGLTLGGGECYFFFFGSSIRGTEAYVRMAGYSWKSNQFGLTVDSVTAFSLVSPNGTEMVVTQEDSDLFFALKVCLNDYDRGRSKELTVDSYFRGDLTTS